MNMSSRITQDVHQACLVLQQGGIVGIPTETVYGLAAVALNAEAVSRVYQAKGRPPSHPLIIHLSPSDNINRWGVLNESAQALANALWPGPLTLLVPRTRLVPDWVTGARDTVALRIPAHDMTIALLDAVSDALVAPSANRFGHVSPTSAEHVINDLGDSVDLVLDGGSCAIGIESTIVECTTSTLQILRPGKISALDVAEITGLSISDMDGPSRAPGMLIAHYAPNARVELCTSRDEATAQRDTYVIKGVAAEVLHYEDVTTYALSMYDDLRSADLRGSSVVLAVLPPDTGLGIAIRDRLSKAAASN
ncbi:MAG: L-threonylcarbamoyladenylate synthase [Actinomycetota bacterium]